MKPDRVASAVDSESFPALVGGRIPSLDGLRAVAILIVITSHLTGGLYNLPFLGAGNFQMNFVTGTLGVRIFFVISGFLITTLLRKEQVKTGGISLRQFYIRRALRILPASYAFLLVMAIATFLGIVAIPRISFLASIFYFRNYVGNDWYTGHLWSLSVEEQFYLIWPAAIVFLPRRGVLIAAFATIPLAPLCHFIRPWFSFEANMDGLAWGCILAYMWGPLGRSERWQRFLRSGLFWAVPVAIFVLNNPTVCGRALLFVGGRASMLMMAVSVERFVRYPTMGAAKLLNLRSAVFVGTLSYSLYLWQEPWVVLYGGQGLWQTFPVNVALACACAYLSYTFIERPFLRFRDRRRRAPREHLSISNETT